MKITDEAVEAAINAQFDDNAIQGFYNDRCDLHLIRDVTKPPFEQELWRIISPDYDAAHASMMKEIERIKMRRVLEAALPYIKGEQEPVAWTFELARAIQQDTKEYTNWGSPQLSFTEPCVPAGSIRKLEPLYAHPSAELERLRKAAQAVIASWDERGTEREKLVTSSVHGGEYWSPAASLVSSGAIAELRAALSEGGETKR